MAAESWAVPAPDLSTFGKRLGYVRWLKGMSREAFLKRLDIDVTDASLGNWEKDKACDHKAEVALAIEREWPEFPVRWVLTGEAGLGPNGPTPGRTTPAKVTRSVATQRHRRSEARLSLKSASVRSSTPLAA